jgi:hypothetical protein
MATNNIFLGTGRRSIGDVVLYRRNGKQVSRIRVRQVANPKTVPQCLQRVYFAPVTKFYSPLAGALERSWEGRNKSESFSRYLSWNLAKARSHGWYLPKGAGWFPLPYQVSSGSLPVLQYEFTEGGIKIYLRDSLSANTLGALSRALVNMGYMEGDQVTVVAAMRSGEGEDIVYTPTYFRFWIDSTSTTRLQDVGNGLINLFLEQQISNAVMVLDTFDNLCGGAVIVSRYVDGTWLRSTQSFVVEDTIMTTVTSVSARESSIESYGNGAAVIDSDIYLNGSTVNGSRAPRRAQQRIVAQIISAVGEVLYDVNPVSVEWGNDDENIKAVVTLRNIANGVTLYAWIFVGKNGDLFKFMLDGQNTYSLAEDEITYMILDASDADSAIVGWLIENGASPDVWA